MRRFEIRIADRAMRQIQSISRSWRRHRRAAPLLSFNDTYDFDVGRNLGNLPRMLAIGRNVNHRVLSLERTAQHCAISAHTVERIVLPTVTTDDQRAPALRWGDPRTMAVLSALSGFAFTPKGFTNADLRERVGALYDAGTKGYTQQKMTYDLRRLRLKHLIQRVPKTHRYVFTPAGRRAALFLTKSYVRLVRPTLDRLEPHLPDDASDRLRRAWQAARRHSKTRRKKQGLPRRSNLPHSRRS